MKIYKIAKKNSLQLLKDNKVSLTEDERDTCLKEKAVWHHGINGGETCAVWKSKDSQGKTWYVTDTHRAYRKSPTLKGAIKEFHDFIKSTANSNVIIKTSKVEDICDVYDLVAEETFNILSEFYSKGRQKGAMMSWEVVSFDRLKKIWEDFMRYGVVRDERGLDDIIEKLLSNLARLQASTDLSGHSHHDPDELIKDHGFRPLGRRSEDFYWNFLDTPYGSPLSDYGLNPLWKIAEQIVSANTYEEKILLVDQMLNVVHQRGDLAALFIEGGSMALSQLSGTNEAEKEQEEEEEVVASSYRGWYKTAVADGEFRDWKSKVNNIKDDVKDLKKEDKDLDRRLKKIEKIIDDLNIGNRRFWQMSNIFTSLQRKVERFDVVEQEWKKFKEEVEDDIKKMIEKKFKGQIK